MGKYYDPLVGNVDHRCLQTFTTLSRPGVHAFAIQLLYNLSSPPYNSSQSLGEVSL
jgi:hypothetical protein